MMEVLQSTLLLWNQMNSWPFDSIVSSSPKNRYLYDTWTVDRLNHLVLMYLQRCRIIVTKARVLYIDQ